MASSTRSSATDDEVARLRAHEARLRERVAELEAELGRRRTRRRSSNSRDDEIESAREVSSRGIDEVSRLARGVVLTSLEALSAATDVVDTVVDEVYERNRADEGESARHLAGTLPENTIDAFFDGLDRALDIPQRTIDKLQSTYREGGSSGRERRTSDRVRDEDQDIRRAVGRPVTRVILDAEDQVILDAGEIITHESIRRARVAGVLDMLLDSVSLREVSSKAEDADESEPSARSSPAS